MAEVRVYVEGGGDEEKTKRLFRLGFSALISKIVPSGRQPRIIACGGRTAARERFAIALREHRDAVCLLLVDSERPVTKGRSVWAFLAEPLDGWTRPEGADDDHAHLMVQCMEAWLVADPAALAQFYDGGFKADKLPVRPNVEDVPKKDVERALQSATRDTNTKGEYHKGRHSFALLALVDPELIRQRSPYAARFFDALRRHCAG